MNRFALAAVILALDIISAAGWAATLDVPYTLRPPRIDGKLDWAEWNQRVTVDLENGFLSLAHDGFRLYVLINVLSDDGDDPYANDGNDQFWLLFDTDEDGAPTPAVDLRYRLSSNGNLRYQTYCDDCADNFSPLEPATYSSRGEGFGCFIDDLSARLFPVQCFAHRVWELAIDLSEIDAFEDRSTRLGYRISSGAPNLLEQQPADPLDFSAYIDINLVLTPRLGIASEVGLVDLQFEVTQAIQTPENELDLAAGKPTAVRIWNNIANASTFKNFIFGTLEGVDLPGSPLLSIGPLSTELLGRGVNPRHSVVSNSFTVLPDSWSRPGTVNFGVTVQALDNSIVETLAAEVAFLPTQTPVLWTVPVRNNLGDGGTTEADPAWISQAERSLSSIAPLGDIDFVRRPLIDVEDITEREAMIEALKQYDLQTRLVWSFMAFLTGEPSYDLPDQITGVMGAGFPSPKGTVIGSSDPAWHNGGSARVTWIASGVRDVQVYAHELNHNLDMGSGTWGRHSGCIPSLFPDLDPDWPYGFDGITIQEVGVAWQGNEFISVSDNTPDLMTYCEAASPPLSWMSPYRWEAWLALFQDASANTAAGGAADVIIGSENEPALDIAAPQDSFYILGRVYPDGRGEFREIVRQPGLSTGNDATGTYTVRVLDCEGGNIDAAGFSVEFVDVEGDPLQFVSFDAVLTASMDACTIVLERDGAMIQSRTVSDNSPWIDLLSPIGGEIWDGIEMITWQAGDDDGDALLFSVLYSPDDGRTWHPVATAISESQYQVDSSRLPGGSSAIVRVLASDGANTGYDQSDSPFVVKEKPPAAVIVAPREGAILDLNEPVNLSGHARGVLGQRLDPSELIWMVDGEAVGTGSPTTANLDEGEHLVELLVLAGEAIAARSAVTVRMVDLNGVDDPQDVVPASIDIVSANGFVVGDFFACEMIVNSGDSGLMEKSRFGCHVDFHARDRKCDDKVSERTGRPDANSACSASDLTLSYRHEQRGGACGGGDGVFCDAREFTAAGALDTECDGAVGGESASYCRIRIFLPLSAVRDLRDRKCRDGACPELDEVSGEYRALGFFESKLRGARDRVPDMRNEALYLILR